MTARASTTPQRHFSQINWRRDIVQFPAAESRAGAVASEPKGTVGLGAGCIGSVSGLLALFGEVAEGEMGDVGGDRMGVVATWEFGESDAFPCPFSPIFGTLRAIGVQY